MSDVVGDTDGEMALGLLARKLVEDTRHHRGREFLRAQSISPTDDARVVDSSFAQRCHYVLIQRLADRAGLLGAIQYRDAARALGYCRYESIDCKGAVEAHLNDAGLVAAGIEPIDRFVRHLGAGAHGDD